MDGSTIVTDMPDLTGVSFWDLSETSSGPLQQDLATARNTVWEQVGRPRYNLGSGPPGRAD